MTSQKITNSDQSSEQEYIIQLEDVDKHFTSTSSLFDRLFGNEDHIKAVDGVSLDVGFNDVQGVIGESGCGKTTLLMVLMGLYDHMGGEIIYKGDKLSNYTKSDWKRYQKEVQMIFQDPFNSFDPKMTMRQSIAEPLKINSMGDIDERIYSVLEDVELTPPENYLSKRPHELSGGELQRVSIARALAVEPELILADEPASMLDVSTQASILNLLSDLIEDYDSSMIYISHDLSTVSYICDTINVMYLGRIVERAPTMDLIDNPKHPYSRALIEAIPIPDPDYDRKRTDLEGATPDPINLGEGCRFADRCPDRMDICDKTPLFVEAEHDHEVACHLHYDHKKEVENR